MHVLQIPGITALVTILILHRRRTRKRPRRATDVLPADTSINIQGEQPNLTTFKGTVPHSQPLSYSHLTSIQNTSPVVQQTLTQNATIVIHDHDNDIQQHSATVVDNQNAEATTYIGRAHYVDRDTALDETSSRAYPSHQPQEVLEKGAAVLQMFNSFDLPSRSIRQSLIDNFLQYCYPWTPILSQGDTEFSETRTPSMLVSQALFLASSRVSSAPGVLAFATPDQFYQRAKTLFYMNHERDPLAVIQATIMLQWYTPDGPEHVSYDAGEFWLKIGVGIAYQVGLHREPSPGGSAPLRRRLWWSLVVSICLTTSISSTRYRVLILIVGPRCAHVCRPWSAKGNKS